MARLGRSLLVLAVVLGLGAAPARAAVFFGDLHAHSGLSDDATGTPDNFFTVARDLAGLDFVVLSDHDIFLTPSEWTILKTTAASFNQDGLFVAFSAVEWTRRWHMNVYFAADDEAMCTTCGAGAADFYTFYGPRVTAGAAAAHVNHPIDAAYPVTWSDIDDTLTTNVEVWNTGSGGDNEVGYGGALWALRAGFRLGLVGVTDDHHTDQMPVLLGTGLTGCHAAALTRPDLLAALRARRCFATSGERMVLDLDVGGTAMGGELTAPLHGSVGATLDVVGTDVPTSLELLRNGDVVATKTDCTTPACSLTAPVVVAEPYTFIYGRVQQPGNERGWTTPVWVHGECTTEADCPPGQLASGGRSPSDCLAEWSLRPGADVTETGRPRDRMSCTDGDPACDADAVAGECTMRVALCLGVTDPRLPHCTPAPVTGYTLLRPNTLDERRGGTLDVQNRALLRAALRALGPAPAPGTCTPLLDLRVPVAGTRPGRRILRGLATAGAATDRDRLELVCRPAGS